MLEKKYNKIPARAGSHSEIDIRPFRLDSTASTTSKKRKNIFRGGSPLKRQATLELDLSSEDTLVEYPNSANTRRADHASSPDWGDITRNVQ